MTPFLILSLYLIIPVTYCKTKISLEPYILGGESSSINNSPYQVSLVLSDDRLQFLCGGSILNSRWVLTAAHCLKNEKKVTVRAGSKNLFDGGWHTDSDYFVIHPKYNPKTNVYDVGLIYLFESIPLNDFTIHAIKLAKKPVPSYTPVYVSGWGSTKEGGINSQSLMEVKLETKPDYQCSKLYGIHSRSVICAGGITSGKDSCQGDSGSPLVLEDGAQIGLVSFGKGCGRKNTPALYANVVFLRDWILHIAHNKFV